MKKLIAILFVVLSGICFGAEVSKDTVRQALYSALEEAKAAMTNAPFGKANIAVLPIPGEKNGLLVGKLKNIITECGFSCVEGKEDPMWAELIKEIAWDERKDDILDPTTLAKFGKLKGVQILVYGVVREFDATAERVYVEVELHATNVETRQHVWGGTFAGRFYSDTAIRGITSISEEVTEVLNMGFSKALESLKEPVMSARLQRIQSVAVIPMAGDIDRQVTGMVVEMLTKTEHLPVNCRIPLLSQVRIAQKDGLLKANAVFYGALRDVSVRQGLSTKDKEKLLVSEEKTYKVTMQMFIEDIKTGEVLWSVTVPVSKQFTEVRHMTDKEMQEVKAEQNALELKRRAEEAARKAEEAAKKAELKKAEDAKKAEAAAAEAKAKAEEAARYSDEGIKQAVRKDLVDNGKSYLATTLWVIGGIIGLFLVFGLVKAYLKNGRIR